MCTVEGWEGLPKMSCSPEPVDVTLFGRRVFADGRRILRWGDGPCMQPQGLSKREAEGGFTGTHRGQDKGETKAGLGEMQYKLNNSKGASSHRSWKQQGGEAQNLTEPLERVQFC